MSLTIKTRVRFNGGAHGRRRIEATKPRQDIPTGRVPRISRLMALAIKMQKLMDSGEIRDYSELARVSHVSRARVTQLMNLNFLAPDVAEEVLFLPRTERGRDPIREHAIRPIAAELNWSTQRRMWRAVQCSG